MSQLRRGFPATPAEAPFGDRSECHHKQFSSEISSHKPKASETTSKKPYQRKTFCLRSVWQAVLSKVLHGGLVWSAAVTRDSDILNRHKAVHGVPEAYDDTYDSRSTVRSRACSECVRAKSRCVGDKICLRCKTRNLECKFPDPLRGSSIASNKQSDRGRSSPEIGHHVGNIGLPERPSNVDTVRNSTVQQPLSEAFEEANAARSLSMCPLPLRRVLLILIVDLPSNVYPGPSFQDQGLEVNMLDPSFTSDINWLSPDLAATFDFSIFDLSSFQDQASPMSTAAAPSHSGESASVSSQPAPGAATYEPLAEQVNENPDVGGGARALYVDSDGSRLPCNERIRRYSRGVGLESFPHKIRYGHSSELRFPPGDFSTTPETAVLLVSSATYSVLQGAFRTYCLDGAPLFIKYQSRDFPSTDHFGYFLDLYFENFHEAWPVLHAATFDVSSAHWLLALAMATIGCHYHPDLEYVAPMEEFLRRAIQIEVYHPVAIHTSPVLTTTQFGRSLQRDESIELIQALLLGYISLAHQSQQPNGLMMVKPLDYIGVVRNLQSNLNAKSDQNSGEWRTWVKAEETRRLEYSIMVRL